MAQIDKPSLHFNTKLYTGTGSSLSVTGVGFQPDWVWIKERNGVTNHFLHDAVRGVTKSMFPNLTVAEDTNAQYLTAFGTDGFTVGTNGGINTNSDTYASWCWKAGTTGSGTSTGSGTGKAYSYSANTTAGFSIVKYIGNGSAGHTIPHHLGAAPKFIATKQLTGTRSWRIYHAGMGNDKEIYFDTTDEAGTNTTTWNNTAPSSTVFTLGTSAAVNDNDVNYVAYVFAPKPGFSSIGSYNGNQNDNGTFIYTGFKPAFVLSKDYVGAGENWFIHDNKRNSFNPTNTYLRPNLTNGDGTAAHYDFHSNGFKNTYSGGSLNSSGRSYLYVAFAENPIVGSNNIPATAK